MAYVVTFHAEFPKSIREYLQSIQGVEVFPGCWVARYGETATAFASRLTPFLKSHDGLLVAPAGEAVSWHSLSAVDSDVRSVLSSTV
jgi:hypothetical protein